MSKSVMKTTRKLTTSSPGSRTLPAPANSTQLLPSSHPAKPPVPEAPIQEFSNPLNPILEYTGTRPKNFNDIGSGFEGPYPPRRLAFWSPESIESVKEVLAIRSQHNGIGIVIRATNLDDPIRPQLEHYDFLRCSGAKEAMVRFLNQGRNMQIYLSKRRTHKFIRELFTRR